MRWAVHYNANMDTPLPTPAVPKQAKAKAKPPQTSQIQEDIAALQDILERLAPLVSEGKYSPPLAQGCKALSRAARFLSRYAADVA